MKETRSNPEGLYSGLVLDGRYRLDRPLAEGGMGTVWIGHQITLQRAVAVKLLRVGTGPHRERLRREALALAAVHHPSIVQVFDYGETEEGNPYLVMELVRGESLGQRVFSRGAFAASVAVQLVLPLLEGLHVAHLAGIVHRDIKPDNVVLSVAPSGVVPKLLDFGIARVGQGEAARLTADGGLVGTPAYMAPEQVRGQEIDPRVDVWGAAVLLYELVSGRPPFGAEDVVVVIQRVLDEPPPFPRQARDFDGRLWSILMGAMRKDREDRTASVLALRDELANWLDARGFPRSLPADLVTVSLPASLSPEARLASTEDAASHVPKSRSSAPRSPAGPIDVAADTAPGAPSSEPAPPLSEDAALFEALIRAKLGQS